ncbi:MAG: toll/interleukin-1 receptor domain-containing protein, partial [Armatimonadetes bacterium]|nr:toll/interleukin-1 receptor domain-containing protein [Armatimonadota bacterium]
MPPASLFVSYSSRDRDRVVPLVEQLRKAGLPVWLDQTDIGAGAEWSGEIIAGLDASQVVLVCLSHSSVVSEEVFREVAYAASARKRFLPVRLEPIELPGRLRYFLSAIHFVDLFGSAAEARASALPELLRQLLSSTPPAEPG